MYIVHIASELAPIAKVGGLGDVVFGLSKELVSQGHKVEVILPKYDCIHYSQLKNLEVEHKELISFEGSFRYNNTIWSADVDHLKVLLLEAHHPKDYFGRGKIYGSPDDFDRFCYFARSSIEYLFKSGKRPDIIHLHDWPAALIAPLYKDMYIPLGFKVGGIVLTIHNLEHQGRCSASHLSRVGLRGESYLTEDKMQDPVAHTLINLLKGGIEYADAITTVSPNYEKEIKSKIGGCHLDKTLIKHENKLRGILNGIDETFWNPETDPHLIKKYPAHPPIDADKMAKILEGKAENRRQLRIHFGLKDENIPIVASVTRLVPQKGPHLIKHALLRTLEKKGQFVLLGSVPSDEDEKAFKQLQKSLSKNKNVAISLDQNEALAHLIFAGADIFVIPSLFEPCGLTQLIALRYGTVPIGRATGGLVDTIFDVDTSNRPVEERNGFLFDFPDTKGVDWALDRAFAYWADQKKWQSIMLAGLSMDFSWKHTAPQYVEVFDNLTSPKGDGFLPAIIS